MNYKWPKNRRIWVVLKKNRTPWILTLYLPIDFRFITSANATIPTKSWTTKETKWVSEFKRLGRLIWSTQYRIEATGKRDQHKQPTRSGGRAPRKGHPTHGTLPTTKVFVEIHDVTLSTGRKRPITATIVPDSVSTTHDAAVNIDLDQLVCKRCTLGYTYKDSKGKVKKRLQRPALHEVGHLLGLEHPYCASDLPRCYGLPGTEGFYDIMGHAMKVSMKDYGIFATFLGRVAEEYHWRVRSRR